MMISYIEGSRLNRPRGRDEEMARALQALEVGAAAAGQPPRGKRPKERQSVHDVIENFKRLVIEGNPAKQPVQKPYVSS